MKTAEKKTVAPTCTSMGKTAPLAAPLAMALSMAASNQAYASIMYSGAINDYIGADQSRIMDVDGDGTNDFLLSHNLAYEELRFVTSGYAGGIAANNLYPTTSSSSSFPFALNLSPGAMVDAALPMKFVDNSGYFNWSATYPTTTSGTSYDPFNWVGANPGYMGFAFDNVSGRHYGWMQIVRNAADGTATIIDWAYESTPDTGITVTAVPEPGTLSMIAMGAAAMTAYRRRQRKQSKATNRPEEETTA